MSFDAALSFDAAVPFPGWLLIAAIITTPTAIAMLGLLLGTRYRVVWGLSSEVLCTTLTRRRALALCDQLLQQTGQQYRVFDRRRRQFVE